MFSFHKPKIYRSNSGCCICRAKSSSSRFTDSKRYEVEFEKCFRIREKRSGEICNACVLLVKRWKKLPEGTNRHWHHVVDARAGPGIKSSMKIKNKLSPTQGKYKSPLRSKKNAYSASPSPGSLCDDLSVNEDSCDKDMFGGSESEESDVEEVRETNQRTNKRKQSDPRISPFLDLSYWKKTEVCCGIIFKGLNGEVLLDPQLFHPCNTCCKSSSPRGGEIRRSRSTDDTESNSSSNSFGDSEYLESGCVDNDNDSLPALENSAALSLTEFQCSNNFSQPPALAMEF